MRAISFASLVVVASAASAQNPPSQQDIAQQVIDAQALGTANAVRPGDEDLSCEALQAEIVAIAQSPEMQAFAQSAGQQAHADLAQIQQAQAEAQQAQQARPGLFRQMVRGAATGVIPGVGQGAAAAQQAEAMARNAEVQAQAEQNVQQIAALGGQAAAMAGPAMRGQRVFELARARDCAWVEEGGLPPGALPPGAVPPSVSPPSAPGAR
jgi:hypothetical protein